MGFFFRFSLIICVILFLVQTDSALPVETTATTKAEPPIKASTCPDASSILPCTCWEYSYGLHLTCSDPAVDQTSIENSFRQLRRSNGIPEDRGVDIYQFFLQYTELTKFDLAPLYGSRMEILYLVENLNLTTFVTSGNPQDHGSIHFDQFSLWSSPINRAGFGDTFTYFSNETTYFYGAGLDLSNPNNSNNNNNTDESEFEFLPGLSVLTNLTRLDLHTCNITGGLNSSNLDIKQFPRLERIVLSGNRIDGIGENVFNSNVFNIQLDGNKLTETSFHPNSGIAQTGRKTSLFLENNQIRTLPSEIFQTFLSAHPENLLGLFGNPLICDEKLSWLKSGREEFQSMVDDANCINDPGHTVFDSELIP